VLLARGTIILEDANVVDAMPRFTSIANPPHGAVLLETIAASLNSARDAYLAPQGGSQFFNCCTLLKRFVKSTIRSRIHRVVTSMAVTHSKRQTMVRSDYSTHEFVLGPRFPDNTEDKAAFAPQETQDPPGFARLLSFSPAESGARPPSRERKTVAQLPRPPEDTTAPFLAPHFEDPAAASEHTSARVTGR
jgi:hypothetical protein